MDLNKITEYKIIQNPEILIQLFGKYIKINFNNIFKKCKKTHIILLIIFCQRREWLAKPVMKKNTG